MDVVGLYKIGEIEKQYYGIPQDEPLWNTVAIFWLETKVKLWKRWGLSSKKCGFCRFESSKKCRFLLIESSKKCIGDLQEWHFKAYYCPWVHTNRAGAWFVALAIGQGKQEIHLWCHSERGNEKTSAEIDFILQYGNRIVPVEVKAEENVRSKSLAQFVKDNAGLKGLRISMRGYVDQGWMENIPLYGLESFAKYL